MVRLTNRLDYERKSLYQLRVLAVDRANQGRVNTGTAAILVKVIDVEDQPPEFVVASPVTRISEDAPVGTSVLQGIFYFVSIINVLRVALYINKIDLLNLDVIIILESFIYIQNENQTID